MKTRSCLLGVVAVGLFGCGGPEWDAQPGAREDTLGGEACEEEGEAVRALALHEGEDPETSAVLRLRPVADTWAARQGRGARDHGRSCELRVNARGSQVENVALMRFVLPSTLPCADITRATVILHAAQLGTPSIAVYASRVTRAWSPGQTGAAACERCNVASGASAPFTVPPAEGATRAWVARPCSQVAVNVLAMARAWCQNPAQNHGLMLFGGHGEEPANFHSMEAPPPVRPYLILRTR